MNSSSSQHRFCDICHERMMKETLMSNYTLLEHSDNENENKDEVDLKFEVRSERVTPSTPSQQS